MWIKILHLFLLVHAEIILSVSWRVGAGENSKEVEVQKKRIQREREIVYKSIHEIPSDPREPWDREIDYDDTLTPEIPIEQLPDTECAETSVCHKENEGTATGDTNLSFQNTGGCSMAEPDMELLAVLLKNPELVFALTSGQANNLSNEETVKLLDMIKANSSSSSSLSVLGGNRKTEEKVEVSLPSPTPSSNPVTVRDLKILYNVLTKLWKIIFCFFSSNLSLSLHPITLNSLPTLLACIWF